MCWNHMIRSYRKHHNLTPRNLWPSIDTDIHILQLSYSDNALNHGVNLLLL